jgi:cytidylate kinase
VADLKERARRRLEQVGHQRPSDDDVAVEAQAIEDRDRRDRERSLSPLRKPEGASEIDTTALTFDEQVEAIVGLVRALTGPPPPV